MTLYNAILSFVQPHTSCNGRMKKIAYLLMSFLALLLVACGGGGGSSGSTGSNTSSSDTSALTVAMVMLDDSGVEVANRAIPPDTKRSIRVTVKDSKGAAVDNAVVKLAVAQDANYVVISSSSSGLTSAGQFTFTVEMSGERKNGAATLTATATSGSQTGTASLAVQTSGGTGVGVAATGLSIALSLIDQSGSEIASRNISRVSTQSLRVTVKNESNQVQPFAFVSLSFNKGADLVKIVGSSSDKLTDANGQASFVLTSQSVSSNGAVEVSVTATSGPVSATNTLALQTVASNVVLGQVSVAPSTVQKGQSVVVNLPVSVNGASAPSNSVSVDLTSTCGTVSPSSALVDGSGNVSAVIQTAKSGTCTVTASANGATDSVVGSYDVINPPANSLQFINASPEIIYQKNSPGTTSSLVKFKLIDTVGNPVSARSVSATLTNTDGGVVFCGQGLGVPVVNVTDDKGEVLFSVCSGTLPTTLQVKASLQTVAGESAVDAASNLLTVQTGLPSQRFFDISATKLNLYVGAGAVVEGGVQRGTTYFSGDKTSINVYLADRLANPVPDGTPVVFVAEGGQIINSSKAGASSCVLKDGGCTVTLIGQEHRPWGSGEPGADPRPGRVTVLAYADGEEAFADMNQNNRYDAGELFEDLGAPFIDNDENGVYSKNPYTQLIQGTQTIEQKFPLPTDVEGTSSCVVSNASNAFVDQGLSVAGTCNNAWDGFTKVRRKIVIVFSGGEVGVPTNDGQSCVEGVADKGFNSRIPCSKRTRLIENSSARMTARISDYNGNPLPADAALGYQELSGVPGCEVVGQVTGNYGNTTEPIEMKANLKGCSGGRLAFTVTVNGKTTSFEQTIP